MDAVEPTDELDAPRGGSHMARTIAIAVGIVLIAFIALLATRDSSDSRSSDSQVIGGAVPVVAGTTLDGQAYDIDSQRGDWVVVNFFASWCTPCKVEQPELVSFADEHAATGDAKVVSVVFQPDDEDQVREFMSSTGASWPVIGGDTGSISLSFGVTGVPESYLVSPDGQVVAKWEGGLTADSINEQIARYGGSATATSTSLAR